MVISAVAENTDNQANPMSVICVATMQMKWLVMAKKMWKYYSISMAALSQQTLSAISANTMSTDKATN